MATDMQKDALRYVRNAGGSPEVAWFDDDHDPIGESLRADLQAAGLTKEFKDADGKLRVELTYLGAKEISLALDRR